MTACCIYCTVSYLSEWLVDLLIQRFLCVLLLAQTDRVFFGGGEFGMMLPGTPELEAADAEIKVPTGENTELRGSPI